ncbi:IcmT/TraK family protein [Brucella sp. JSBI001]|uniref:IcmT/TraK family protein n=1 Tax=Brucella/Ochrobactrum group TaxID=2826938 RepID=UPI0029FF074D|nr:IcmT/TraK family protein [Brucella sp. JSBI001]
MSEQEFEDGNRFKRKVHWRDSMREPRLMIFDARLVFFFLLLAVHLAVWTAVLLLAAMLVFWLVERAGYRFPSALRTIRATFAGHRRPAFYQRRYREAVDYGFEYRRSPSPPPIPAQKAPALTESEPVETQAGRLPLAAE